MKKLKAILWAIWIKITSPFRKKYSAAEIQETLVKDFGFMGQERKPFPNAIAYEYDPKIGEVRECIYYKSSGRIFVSPGCQVLWASNLKNAKKKAFKIKLMIERGKL